MECSGECSHPSEESRAHEVRKTAERDEVGVDERHHLVAVGEEALDANANLREGGEGKGEVVRGGERW